MSQIEYTTSEMDLVAFSDYHVTHSPTLVRAFRWVRFGFAGAFILFGLLTGGSVPGFLPWLILAAVWIPLLPVINRRASRRRALRMYREGANPTLVGKHQLRAEPDALISKSEASESRVMWSAVQRVGSTPDHTFIYIGAVNAFVVPRAGVLGGDYDGFVAAVRRYAQKAAA